MSTEARVAEHYSRGTLEKAILAAVESEGKDPANLTADDLAAADEFHVGGQESTQELAAHMDLRRGMHLLDVGSGIGGPARYFANHHCCTVTGVDLTEGFVQAANSLSRLVKLNHLVEFHRASALALPFGEATFDCAYMIHVGMNIEDKAGVFREVRRVLKPGGLFMIFDFVRTSEGALRYPVPWALSEETSFVDSVKNYRDGLKANGFRVVHERTRKEFAIQFIERNMALVKQGGPPPLGIHLLLGEKMPAMMGNVLAMMREGLIEPVELCAKAV